MTLTQTLPPGVDLTPDLEAWLRGEIEKPCDVTRVEVLLGRYVVEDLGVCGRRARWYGHFKSTCGHRSSTHFLCNRCKRKLEREGMLCGRDPTYPRISCSRMTMTFIERITRRWWQ